jgi:hypothetical protein
MYTHWACFDCRKSFAKDESATARKCPECAKEMTDMGAYFEPPRKLNARRWQVMKTLAEHGYRFGTKDAKVFIQNRLLQVKNPRLADVVERIELEMKRKSSHEQTRKDTNKN